MKEGGDVDVDVDDGGGLGIKTSNKVRTAYTQSETHLSSVAHCFVVL